VWAVALCTFWGCRRLGETTVSSAAAFDGKYHVLRSTLVSFRELRNGTRSVHFRIPWTKTTKHEGTLITLTARNDALCPRTALQNHIDVNSNIPPTSALFAYHTSSSGTKNMLKQDFLAFVMSIWKSAHLAHVLGHSFRIGGAVELLLAGVAPEIVAATGGWTSLAFLIYWRRMEEILPMSTSKAYKQSHVAELASIFEEFRIAHNISLNLITAMDS